jgi:tRNA-dihydrouridine synthase B
MLSHHPIACLAPLDGFTDTAYRRIVRRLNPDVILFSEFTSIDGIKHSDVVRSRLDFKDEELPYIIQLFGNDPKLFACTVEQFQDSGITGIDINMGCPSKNIVRSNSGGSLMKDQDLACRIVEACRKNSQIPVSVKTRLGWSDDNQLIPFVKALVDAGAQLITIHGRTYKQKYKGEADWTPIYKLKEEIEIPVIGNGDLKGLDHALEMLQNLDGYMIGRASIGNPWVFWSDAEREKVMLKEKIDVMIQHYELLREYKQEKRALVEFRKHISGYIVGFPGAKACRSMLMHSENEKEFIANAQSLAHYSEES